VFPPGTFARGDSPARSQLIDKRENIRARNNSLSRATVPAILVTAAMECSRADSIRA
jgi:hypothetical protein